MRRHWLVLVLATAVFSLLATDGYAVSHQHVRHVPTQNPRAVHVGHSGPYCIYCGKKHGSSSPYHYVYKSRRYPRYYGSTHVRALQNVGIPTGDIGIRDTAW